MIVASQMQPGWRSAVVSVCMLAAIAAPRQASAQTRPTTTEVYGGFSYLWDPDNSVLAVSVGDGRFAGWMAGAARPVWRSIAVAAEGSGHYKRQTEFDDLVSLSYHTLSAGPRVSADIGRFRGFGQLLAGTVHSRASGFGVTVAATRLLLQPGIGVDYPVHRRLAARLQLDYRRIGGAEDRGNASQVRAVGALVYR